MRTQAFFAATVLALAAWPQSARSASVFPAEQWAVRSPSQAGMSAVALDRLRDFLGGRGCVVRHGYMVYSWGDQSRREDVASACKPVIAHLLFEAVESGRLAGLDEPVVKWQSCLAEINADLAFKDRAITFRHLATQTSCYGVSEPPGRAFDYNDWAMSLLWDTLVMKVYGASLDTVDEKVLHPLLTDALQCQDDPTFLAFGKEDRPGRLGVSVRDFARFGLLYLNQGRWDDKQLIDPKTAVMAVSSPLPNSVPRTTARKAELCPDARSHGSRRLPDDQTDHLGSYSYLWWTNGIDRDGNRHWPHAPIDTFGAFGHANGQRAVVVIPSYDLVISWNDTTLGNRPGNPRDEAFQLLMAAVDRGPITADPDRPAWFKRADGSPVYMCGPGDPEGFLYRGKLKSDGTRDGDQMDLIRKLAGTGANCIYLMAIRSHGGDGDATENPFVDHDPAKPLNDAILAQWETWFAAMDRSGIIIYLFVYDDSACPFGRELPADGKLKPEEAAFLDALVARFEHHDNLVWCVAEEYREKLSPEHATRIAEQIRRRDRQAHPVAIHQNHGVKFDFDATRVAAFQQFAVQWNVDTPKELHDGTVASWKDVRGRLNINMSEFADSRHREPFAGTGEDLRKKIWAIAMGGGYSMILGMDIASTPAADLEACGRLVGFMESTRFHLTAPQDELARGDTMYVLAAPGEVYIAYGDAGPRLGLLVREGRYRVSWFDPVGGTSLDAGVRELPAGEAFFERPKPFAGEAVLCLDASGADSAQADR